MAKAKVKNEKPGYEPLNTFEKIVIAISVVLVLATVACGVVKWGFSKIQIANMTSVTGEEKPKIDQKTLKIMDLILPDTVELETGDGVKFNVGLEVNMDFDSTKTENIFGYFDILKVYDWEGKQIGDEEKIQKYGILGKQLKLMALLKVADRVVEVKEIVNNVLVVLILLDIVAGVMITYFIWRRADDRRELREKELNELNIQKVTGVSEEEARRPKKNKKKKKK